MATYHSTDDLRHESLRHEDNDHTALYFIVGLLFAAAVIFGVYYYTAGRTASDLPAGATTVEQVGAPVMQRTAIDPAVNTGPGSAADTSMETPVGNSMSSQRPTTSNSTVR